MSPGGKNTLVVHFNPSSPPAGLQQFFPAQWTS